MGENNYEEREDFYNNNNNQTIDPDIALSYIDEKLQNVLGHFQKDFECGDLSSENLGTTFGGYGSFLPTHKRTPSILSRPNNPKEVQNLSSPKSPNVLPVEGATKATAQSTRLGAAPAPRSLPLLNTAMASSTVITDKKDSGLSSNQGNKFLVKEEPVLNKQAGSSDMRTLKVRIKIKSDKTAKNIDAIYSGFGLNTTPSSSMGNSEDSSAVPSQCAGTLEKSPSDILQIMTSFPVPGDSPLSPLVESLLCLEMKEKSSLPSCPKIVKKFSKEKKKSVVEKRDNIGTPNGEIDTDHGYRKATTTKPGVDFKVGNMESETIGQGSSSFSDKTCPLFRKEFNVVDSKKGANTEPQVCKEAERNVSQKKIEVSKKRMKDILSVGIVREESLESISDQNGGNCEKKDIQSNSTEKITESRSNMYCKDELFDITRTVQDRRSEDCTISKTDTGRDPSGQTVVGHDEYGNILPHGVEKSSSKGKKTARSQISADLASEPEGSLISGSNKGSKGKRKSLKMRNLKSQDDTRILHGNFKALEPEARREQVTNHTHYSPERPSGNAVSKSSRGVVERKHGSLLHKSRELSTAKDVNAQLISKSSLKESTNGVGLSLQEGLVSMVEPIPVAPLVIEENWVQCDRCEKWRLLPYGTKSEQLPDKWVCRMLDWLPGMNRCEFSEDQTTEALRRLYLSEQSNLTDQVDRIVIGASSAEGVRLNVDNHNPSSKGTAMANPRRTQPKSKETLSAANNGVSALLSGSVKDFQLDVVKRRSLHDMKQKLSVEKNTRHHEDRGDFKEKNLKSKRAADQYEHGTPKRPRIDVVSGAVKITKKVPSSLIPEGDLLQPVSSETKTFGEREISLKKRKLKDWQESQNCTGASKDDGNLLNVRKNFVKEETRDEEVRKLKKSAISNVERRDLILHNADDKSMSIGKIAKLKKQVHGREEPFNVVKGQQERKQKRKGSVSVDMDNLNRDWGSEQFSRAATSSSSKVSDSLRSRSHFLEVKGSPVESVSSSPIRASNLEQLSTRRDSLRKNVSNNGHIPMVDSVKKSIHAESKTVVNKTGTVRRVKVSGGSHSGSPGFPALDFRETSNDQKFGSRSRVRGESPDKYQSVHLVNNGSNNLESQRAGGLQPLDRFHSDDKSKKKPNKDNAVLREKSKNGSSLLSKGKDGSSGSNPERMKVSIRPSEKPENPKRSLTDGVKTGSDHVALLHGDSRDLKCRIKLVKDDSRDKLTREKTQQNCIQGYKDDVARRNDVSRVEPTGKSSSQVASNLVANKDSPAQIPPPLPCLRKGNVLVPADSSCSGDSSKGLKQYHNAQSPSRNNASSQSCAVFEEAKKLKDQGDRLKNSGFFIHGSEAYFQAALLFLQAASLRESCSYDNNKLAEMSPMQIYSNTAKLCELCADEYEKHNDLAAAALAYKCVYVAYMRVVYCKSSTINRDRHDLQASLQIVPQGESSSSSASDVDSLNNQGMVDKAAVSKSFGSNAGNHIIAARNRPNFARLLDFTKDVNTAMEASDKSQKNFDAAIKKGCQTSEAIDSVKRVIDFSFQDVDELVRLVRIAYGLIVRQGDKVQDQ